MLFYRSDVFKILQSNQTETLKTELYNLTESFPKKSDWRGACNGIFLLQEHYNLGTTSFIFTNQSYSQTFSIASLKMINPILPY